MYIFENTRFIGMDPGGPMRPGRCRGGDPKPDSQVVIDFEGFCTVSGSWVLCRIALIVVCIFARAMYNK
jgi:hypothetical protein